MEKSSFNQILSSKKKLCLFGAGEIAQKTFRRLDDTKISCIVDNSKNLQGTDFKDFIVKDPSFITKDLFIIICSTAITPISEQLTKMGLKAGINFVISPILNDLLIIEKLEKISGEIFFTSGSIPVEKENEGGGLYKLTIKEEKQKLKKIYSGPCYGTFKWFNSILFIDTDVGIMKYDPKTQRIEKLAETPKNSRAHGISYNHSNNRFYVSCSNLDAVIEFDSDFKERKRFCISKKIDQYKRSMHHCNDNYSEENSLYVSMFSSTGNWKKGVFDGCIAEFDIESGKRLRDIKNGLYMPHNICKINGSLQILDSLPGHLRAENFEILGTFPAFTRGLTYHEGLYYIGQSKNRNFSKVIGISNNISIDCGIIIFDPETKVSRTLKLSNRIGEIHSIRIL